MAFIAEGRTPFGDGMFWVTLAGMAITAGIGTCRAMDVFYRQQLLMTDETGIVFFDAAVHLRRCRVHHMARLAEALFFRAVQRHWHILWRNLLIAAFRCIKNRKCGRFDLLGTVKQVNNELVNTRIP